MGGRVEYRATPTVLLADANVLIDYRESELEVLGLVSRHVAQMAVLSQVLSEVRDVTRSQCERLGIRVVEVETEQMLQAEEVAGPKVSFNDRLCLVVCRKEGWTCVTNDGALQSLCERHGVNTRFGLGLLMDLVATGNLTSQRAIGIARQVQEANPGYISKTIIQKFMRSWISKLRVLFGQINLLPALQSASLPRI